MTQKPYSHLNRFHEDLIQHIVALWNASASCSCLVCFRPPRQVVDKYKLKGKFLKSIACGMDGSHDRHTAYVCLKEKKDSESPSRETETKLPSVILETITATLRAANPNSQVDPFHASPTDVSPKRTRSGHYGPKATAPKTSDGTQQTGGRDMVQQGNNAPKSVPTLDGDTGLQELSTTARNSPMDQVEETMEGRSSTLHNRKKTKTIEEQTAASVLSNEKKRNLSDNGKVDDNGSSKKKPKNTKEENRDLKSYNQERTVVPAGSIGCAHVANPSKRKLFGRHVETNLVSQSERAVAGPWSEQKNGKQTSQKNASHGTEQAASPTKVRER